jgi:hypothetical protein
MLFDLIAQIIFLKECKTCYLLLFLLRPNYFLQRLTLEYPPHMSLFQYKRPNFTPMWHSWKESSSVCLTLLACTLRRWIQNILEWACLQFTLFLILSCMMFSFVRVITEYLKTSSVTYGMIELFMLCLCFACCWRDMNKYLVFSEFDCGPFTTLVTDKASVLCFTVFISPVNLHHQHWLAVHLLLSI